VSALILPFQAELEHRTPKSRYRRTSRKGFTKQLAQIERRQARIRRLSEQLAGNSKAGLEMIPHNPDEHYNVAKSQNHPVNITQFVQKHAGDPAIVVGLPILPGVLVTYQLSELCRKTQETLITAHPGCVGSREIFVSGSSRNPST
jgi:hypothetical protein